MNAIELIKHKLPSAITSPIALLLILSTLIWATGAPLLLNNADAAQLTSVSDTLSDSDLGVLSKHTIRWTTATSTIAGQTIVIQLDPDTHAFSQTFSSATSTDIVATGFTVVDTCGVGSDEVTVTGNYNNGSNENITLTVCAGDSISSGAKILGVGTSTMLWTNPSSAGSYRVTIGGNWDDSGTARVAVLDDVVVTASVNTSFTFTVAGLATSTNVNGDTTTGSTTATVMAFNTLTAGAAKVMGQSLTVTTNAANGFAVTVQQNQNLTSSTGADIDLFADGASTSVPTTWASPSNTLGQEWTYGHFGVTSEDSDLNGDEFGASLYAGNIDYPRRVFSHNGPTNGLAADTGTTEVAYKLEIATLQEAGTDYTNTLTYVATPTF